MPFVDVLRAAAAEVEDYTRVRVVCRTPAALASPAVADVIHLLAEFVENATIFSPPNTEIRVTGELVAKGFAVDIEDRGLGMDDDEFADINASLANPPLFDPSGSDRFGLFVAAQLARRHGIRAKLRRSDYGGVTAIVLIPLSLVVPANALGDGRAPGRVPNGRLTTAAREVTAPPGQRQRPRQRPWPGTATATASTPPRGPDALWPTPPSNGDRAAAQPSGDRPAAPDVWELAPASPAPEVPRPRPTPSAHADPTAAPGPSEPYARLDAEPPPSPVATDPERGTSARLPVRADRERAAAAGPPAEPGAAAAGTRRTAARHPPPAPRSPETARDVMSAFQRGWRRGLADGEPDQLTDLTDLPQERE